MESIVTVHSAGEKLKPFGLHLGSAFWQAATTHSQTTTFGQEHSNKHENSCSETELAHSLSGEQQAGACKLSQRDGQRRDG